MHINQTQKSAKNQMLMVSYKELYLAKPNHKNSFSSKQLPPKTAWKQPNISNYFTHNPQLSLVANKNMNSLIQKNIQNMPLKSDFSYNKSQSKRKEQSNKNTSRHSSSISFGMIDRTSMKPKADTKSGYTDRKFLASTIVLPFTHSTF